MGTRVAFKTANSSYPAQGNRELPVALDFTNTGTIQDTLYNELSLSQIESIQSVWIDNNDNPAPLIIQFQGGNRIVAQPYSQGVYPVLAQAPILYKATTSPGIVINVLFSNTEKQYFEYGAVPGVLIVPALTNLALDLAPSINGDNVLVAGIANQTIKVYRSIISFNDSSNVKFWSGPSAANRPLTGTFYMFAGGGLTMQPSGIPWFTTQAGDNLVMSANSAVNIGGELGYVQS